MLGGGLDTADATFATTPGGPDQQIGSAMVVTPLQLSAHLKYAGKECPPNLQ
jgi:hypothetical protein